MSSKPEPTDPKAQLALCGSSGTAGGSPPTSALLEGTFYVEARQSHRPRCLKASRRSAEPTVHPQSCSLRQEVDRLMQDHNPGSSHLWPLHPKAAKRPVSPEGTVLEEGGSAFTLSPTGSRKALKWTVC